MRRDSTLTLDDLQSKLGVVKPRLRLLCSRQFGLRLLVEQAFAELGYKDVLAAIDEQTRRSFSVERLVFGMVLQQVVSPGSKLRAAERLADVVFYPEGESMDVHHYYRALDEIAERGDEIEAGLREALKAQGLTFKIAGIDLTSSYFESDYDDVEWREIAETPDPARKALPVVNDPPLRMRGYSRDKRPSKPQIVVEHMVSEGYVIHHELHAGNTADQTVLADNMEKLSALGLTDDVIWTADTGMNTKKARQALAFEDVDFVLGEGKRKTKVAQEVLTAGGRYRQSPDNPSLAYRSHRRDDRLFVVRLNRSERKRDLQKTLRHVNKVEAQLAKSDDAASSSGIYLLGSKTLKRYVKRRKKTPHRLELDKKSLAKIRSQAGKSVISTSLLSLEPEHVDELYRLQFGVEDSFRTAKSDLELRPIRHRRADRIRAHVLVQVMALNVVRHLQHKTGMRLPKLRDVMASVTVQAVEFGGTTYWQSVELTKEQRGVFASLGFDLPLPRFTAEVVSD